MSAGVVALTWYCAVVLNQTPGWELLVTGAGTLLVYNLDHLRDDRRQIRAGRGPRLAPALRWILLGAAALGLLAGFALAGLPVLVAALPSGIVGLLYGAPIGGRRLKDLPGSKAWLVATAVTWAVIALPLAGEELGRAGPELWLFVLALTTLNAHAFDLRDVGVDRDNAAWTWAAWLGPERARRRLVAAAGIATLAAAGWAVQAGDWERPVTLGAITAGLLGSQRWSREAYGVWFDGLLLLPAAWRLLS